jgi:signal transduction histidine kinase
MNILRFVLLFLACLLKWHAAVWGQTTMSIDSAYWEPYPEQYMEFVVQPFGTFWQLADVQQLPDSVWRPLEKESGVYFGITTKGHWLRFRIRNDLDHTVPLLLECNNPNLDTLALYRVSPSGELLADTTGTRFPPKARALNYPNLIFQWKEPGQSSATVYLYARALYNPANFTFSLWNADRWQLEFKQIEIGASILFFALLFVYLFTLTLLFSIVRERHLWLFYFYVLLGGLFIACDLGLWYWIWPGWDYRILAPTLTNLSLVCGLLFIRYQLKTYRRYQYIDWSLILLCAMALATSGLTLLLRNRPVAFMGVNKILVINLLATCAAIVWLILHRYFTSRKSENIWFVVAFTPHGLAVVLTCLHQLDIAHPDLPGLAQFSPSPSPFFVQLNTPWLLLGGMLWEMLIISVLFVLRIKDFYESSNRVLAERRNALVLGVETERKRVAQEIHDGIGVLLSSTKMKLAALRAGLKDQTDLYRETGDLVNNIDQAHEEMRGLAYSLMPKSLEKLGLAQAIEGTVSRMRRNHPAVHWQFYSNFKNGHLDDLTKINLFRIAQEMLHNVLQHAQATEAHLQLLQRDKRILLSIEDNGVGFQTTKHRVHTGIGLSNIRYRAEDVLKGHVTIESSPGKGTFMAVEVPA